MKPAPFEYHAPVTVADAVGLLAEHGDEAKVLAGGQSLVPMLALRLARFGHLVDLNRVTELDGISRENGSLRIASMTRQAVVGDHPDVAKAVPLLAQATPLIGHFQIRNRGTLGGSIAHADPASEYPAVALALDARMEVAGTGGTRMVPASEFFVSTWTTSMETEELLTAVHFPVWEGRCGWAVEEVARRHGDFALVGAACGVRLGDDDAVEQAGVALFGVATTPFRAGAVEQALVGATAGADLAGIAREGLRDLEPTDDVHASADYRRRVSAVVVERALRRAIEEAARG